MCHEGPLCIYVIDRPALNPHPLCPPRRGLCPLGRSGGVYVCQKPPSFTSGGLLTLCFQSRKCMTTLGGQLRSPLREKGARWLGGSVWVPLLPAWGRRSRRVRLYYMSPPPTTPAKFSRSKDVGMGDLRFYSLCGVGWGTNYGVWATFVLFSEPICDHCC